MPHKKNTTPKTDSAKTNTRSASIPKSPKISPPRGFSPKEEKKLSDLTTSIHKSANQFPSQAIKEVLKVLTVVELQFNKLRDEQQKQDAVYDELIRKIQAIEKVESKLTEDRTRLTTDRKKAAQTNKKALERIENRQLTLEQKQEKFRSERQASTREFTKLRNAVEQESKSLHEEHETLVQNAVNAEQKADKHSQKIKELNSDRKELASQIEQLQEEALQAQRQAREVTPESQEHALQIELKQEDIQSRLDELQGDRNLLNARVEEIEQERSELIRQRDEAEVRNQELELRLAELADQIESLQKRLEELKDQDGKSETQADSLHDRIAQLDADLVDRDRIIDSLQEQVESASRQEDMVKMEPAEKSEIQPLRERVAELESELADAKVTSTASMSGSDESAAAKLDQIKANLQEAAIHLHRRQERLQRMRQLLQESKQASPQAKSQAAPVKAPPAKTRQEEADLKRWVQNQRQRLALDQTRLKEMESRMIKRWAPRNASLIASTLGLLLCIIVAASWLTTSIIFPAHISASVTLKPQTSSLNPLTEEQTTGWQLWHAELVGNDEFKKTLLKRMQDRQMPVEDIDLDQCLDDNFSLDTGMPSELTMTLSGTNKREVTDLLDVITSTVLIESNRQLKKRSDGAYATASNERKESGISRYAVLNPVAISDHRMLWMTPIFLLYGLLAFGVFKFALSQLNQVKRVINEKVSDTDESDIFNDSTRTSNDFEQA